MRPEGWFLIACIKNHGINPAQYCRLKCIKAAKREPSHGYYDEVPILLFLFRVFHRGLFCKKAGEPPVKITARSFRLRQSRAWRSGQGRCTTGMGEIPSAGALGQQVFGGEHFACLMGRAATMLLRAMALLGASLAVRCLWPSPRAASTWRTACTMALNSVGSRLAF